MTLIVCPLADVDEQVRLHRPAGVISLLSPDQPAPEIATNVARLVLRFHDIAAPSDGLIAPDARSVGQLLAFAAALGSEASLLVHCWMGISRSPAAAFILACARDPMTTELSLAQVLRLASPSATPNPLLVRLADERLARGGRMSAAIASIGRGRDAMAGEPFQLGAGIRKARR